MKKGYIGAIGDDFPAIFPIAMGLMIFFGSIVTTYDIYNAKQTIATNMRANILISKSITATRNFEDGDFAEACMVLEDSKINYGVKAFMELNKYTAGDRFEEKSVFDKYGIGPGARTSRKGCGDSLDEASQNVVTMFYPVTVMDDAETIPVTLVIKTWQ